MKPTIHSDAIFASIYPNAVEDDLSFPDLPRRGRDTVSWFPITHSTERASSRLNPSKFGSKLLRIDSKGILGSVSEDSWWWCLDRWTFRRVAIRTNACRSGGMLHLRPPASVSHRSGVSRDAGISALPTAHVFGFLSLHTPPWSTTHLLCPTPSEKKLPSWIRVQFSIELTTFGSCRWQCSCKSTRETHSTYDEEMAATNYAAHLGWIRSARASNRDTREKRGVRARMAAKGSATEGQRGKKVQLSRNENDGEHRSDGYHVEVGVDDGSETVLVDEWIEERESETPVGVFAVYDRDRKPQFVSYSTNVVVSVRKLREHVGDEKCTYMRVAAFENETMATGRNMERELENWLNELGGVPPGNGEERDLWNVHDEGMKILSKEEVQAYQDRKLEMREAVGEKSQESGKGEAMDAKEGRPPLVNVVDGEGHSEVTEGQAEEAGGQRITSPFSNAVVHREVGKEHQGEESMTVESVDRCLEEVRPYLIADGGNVEVVQVEDGKVYLRLQGACGTCASSTTTMKMGIERAIQAAFATQLKEIIQLDASDTSTSIAAIDGLLNSLRPAIQGLGGSVEVLSLENGVCKIKYAGPEPIGMGVKAAVQDRFDDLKAVELV